MHKIFNLSLLLLIVSSPILSQNSDIELANKLFEEGEFSISQNIYINLSNSYVDEDFRVFRIANCSKNLGNSDVKFWYENLIENYPNSEYYQESIKDLAFVYFSDKNYAKANSYLRKVSDKNLIDDEFYFKFAYSLFTVEEYNDAKYYFNKIREKKYKSLSLYYYAHISYLQGLYNKSLESFLLLEDDKTFSKIVPYYITQIYFELEKYTELVNYAVPVLEFVIPSREVELNKFIAESYYRLEDYEKSEFYFKKYIVKSEDIDNLDYFKLGQINVFLEDYDESVSYFEKVENVSDSLLQFNSYYLGKSYLKQDKKIFALNAFKKSSEINSDLQLKEESLYNYFKLAYELDLPYTDLSYVLDEFTKHHLSKYKSEVKRLLINMFQSTNQYQQAFDFLKNNHLPKQEEKETLQRLSYYIGVQHYNNANYSNALVKFEFSRKHPENNEIDAMSLYLIADCYYQLKDYKRSISHYEDYLETPSNSLIEKIGVAKYNLAYSYFKSKQYSLSSDHFRKAINSEIDDERKSDALLRLADSYYMQSNFKNALRYYKKYENNSENDYALFQRSKCNGLLSDYKSQEKCLLEILENEEENFIYLERSYFDLAKLYKNQDKDEEALIYYDKVLELSSDNEVLSSAILSKALIYFNKGEINNSILSLKNVIENYPKTKSFKGAKIGLKDAYVKKGDVNEYLIYINDVPQLDISVSAKDSLTYQVAYNNFKNNDFITSKANFKKYISDFGENSIFDKQSHYYYAESSWETADTAQALVSYKKVLDFGSSVFYEPSLVRICRTSYDKGNESEFVKYYQLLDSTASSIGLQREAIIRLMFGFEFANTELAVKYSERVLLSDKLNDRLIARSKIIIARNDFENGNFARSSDLCDDIASLTKNKDGSEAMYLKSYFAFLDDNLEESEELVFKLADEYSSNHWIAKGFILLSDIYVKQENLYQAKATLESIIENHDGEELINVAKRKWENIVKQDQLEKVNTDTGDATIEIGEELDYEIDYSILQIEEELED